MTDDDTIERAFKWAEAHRHIVVPLTPDQQRDAFLRNTGLALEAHRQVLSLELDDCDPLYKAKLQAKTAAASQQLIAALRADENKLKAVEINRDIYKEIRAAIDAHRAKKGDAKQIECKGVSTGGAS
jgi:hypothetical protein